jgi:hypothetical protein
MPLVFPVTFRLEQVRTGQNALHSGNYVREKYLSDLWRGAVTRSGG